MREYAFIENNVAGGKDNEQASADKTGRVGLCLHACSGATRGEHMRLTGQNG